MGTYTVYSSFPLLPRQCLSSDSKPTCSSVTESAEVVLLSVRFWSCNASSWGCFC